MKKSKISLKFIELYDIIQMCRFSAGQYFLERCAIYCKGHISNEEEKNLTA